MKVFRAKKFAANQHVKLTINTDSITISVQALRTQYAEGDDGVMVEQRFAFDNESLNYISTFEIKLSDLQSGPQADSGACFNVYASEFSPFPVIVNSSAMSQPFRGDVHQSHVLYVQKPPVAVICIPRLDSTFDECLIGINTLFGDAETTFECSVPFTEIEDSSSLDALRKMVRPSMSIGGSTSIQAGGTDTFTVSVVKQDGSVDSLFNDHVYFETTGGILAVSKVKAVNGVAQARLVGQHLIAGDVVTVKAGTKFFTSLAKMDVQVTA